MAFNYEYPYTDPNRYNSDWLLNAMKKLQEEWKIFVPTHEVKFSGIWDGTKTYGPYSIVSDNDLNSYISIVAVPAGVQITDERYWLQIGSYNAQITQEVEAATKLIMEEVETTTNQIREDMQSSALKLGTRKFIFISDSYGVRTISDGGNWIKILCNLCGISSSNVTELCRGSSGFTRPNEQKWLNMLINAGIVNKEEITDIFIGGGANDVASEYATVLSAISEFMSYVKVNYPNATVWIAHFGLTFTVSDMSRRYKTSLSAYRNASLYGARYVYNSEYILCDNTLLESDKVHPNETGIITLANALTKAILTGSCDVHYFAKPTISLNGSSSLNVNDAAVYKDGDAFIKLDNEAVTILGGRGGSFARISYTTPAILDANSVCADLFKLSPSYIVGTEENRKCINGFATFNHSGGKTLVPCTFYVQDNSDGVNIGIITYNDAQLTGITGAQFIIGGNYLTSDM